MYYIVTQQRGVDSQRGEILGTRLNGKQSLRCSGGQPAAVRRRAAQYFRVNTLARRACAQHARVFVFLFHTPTYVHITITSYDYLLYFTKKKIRTRLIFFRYRQPVLIFEIPFLILLLYYYDIHPRYT